MWFWFSDSDNYCEMVNLLLVLSGSRDSDMVMVNWYCRGCFLIRRGGSCRSPIASGRRHWWWRGHRSLKWVSASLHAEEAGCSLRIRRPARVPAFRS